MCGVCAVYMCVGCVFVGICVRVCVCCMCVHMSVDVSVGVVCACIACVGKQDDSETSHMLFQTVSLIGQGLQQKGQRPS